MSRTNGRALILGLLVPLLVYVGGYFLLTALMARNLAGTGWFSPAALGGGQPAGQVSDGQTADGQVAGGQSADDPFAAPVGAGNATLDAVRENALSVVDGATLWLMAAGFALSLIWVVWWRLRAPGVAGPQAGRSGAPLWWGLLIAAILFTVGWGFRQFATTSLGEDLNGDARWWIGFVYLAATILSFWLATAWPTPNVLRPSVPLGGSLPLHGGRS